MPAQASGTRRHKRHAERPGPRPRISGTVGSLSLSSQSSSLVLPFWTSHCPAFKHRGLERAARCTPTGSPVSTSRACFIEHAPGSRSPYPSVRPSVPPQVHFGVVSSTFILWRRVLRRSSPTPSRLFVSCSQACGPRDVAPAFRPCALPDPSEPSCPVGRPAQRTPPCLPTPALSSPRGLESRPVRGRVSAASHDPGAGAPPASVRQWPPRCPSPGQLRWSRARAQHSLEEN